MINGYTTVKGRFYKNPHYELLKKIVKKSKDISNEYKDQALKYLIKEDITYFFIGDGKKYKYLFANGLFYRAYDIYTSSLIAYHLRNRNSIYLLMRAQFENMGKIAFYVIHPDKIKESFDPKKDHGIRFSTYCECLAELYKKDGYPEEFNSKYLTDMFDYFSGMAHPFSDGLKMYYGGTATMTRVPDSPYPVWKPSLNMKAHHFPFSEEEKNFYLTSIMIYFSEIFRLLPKIFNLEVDDEVNDYSELHTSWSMKHNKKEGIKKNEQSET